MNEAEILKLYNEDHLSTYQIAEMYGTYPNKINRMLKSMGVDMKNKSAAQSNAIKSGRHKHPTKGRERSDTEKVKISESVYKYWQDMDEDERQRRVDIAKAQWDSMSEAEREDLRTSAAQAVRVAAREGSKMEKFLVDKLLDSGYNIVSHERGLIPDEALEVDIFLPDLSTIIEIDGPSHFLPIWGEENLQRHITADAHKSGMLLSAGYTLIRVKCIVKSVSGKHQRDLLESVLQHLKKIDKKFPGKKSRYIELEIK